MDKWLEGMLAAAFGLVVVMILVSALASRLRSGDTSASRRGKPEYLDGVGTTEQGQSGR